MTHAESRKRDEAIAAYVRIGKTITEACVKFNQHRNVIGIALRRHGVKPLAELPALRPSSYKVLADLQNTTETLKAIGKKHRVTRQAIHELLTAAKAAGIHFPNR